MEQDDKTIFGKGKAATTVHISNMAPFMAEKKPILVKFCLSGAAKPQL